MTIPNWWSSYGEPQIASNTFGYDNYECEWSCDLRLLHNGLFFQADIDILERCSGIFRKRDSLRIPENEVFDYVDATTQFSGMRDVIERLCEQRIAVLVQALDAPRS